MQTQELFFWAVVAILCIVLEMHTAVFVSAFFAVGAAISFVLALIPLAFVFQVIAFLIISGIGLLIIRPFALKRFPLGRRPNEMAQPAKSPMTGATGIVEVAVGGESNPGRVKIQGETWKAVTRIATPIPAGTAVVVKEALGTTLWIEPTITSP